MDISAFFFFCIFFFFEREMDISAIQLLKYVAEHELLDIIYLL